MDNVFTVSDLSRKLGLTVAVVKSTVKEMSPDLSINGGYYKLYDIDRVRDALIERNRTVLEALGFVERKGQPDVEESA